MMQLLREKKQEDLPYIFLENTIILNSTTCYLFSSRVWTRRKKNIERAFEKFRGSKRRYEVLYSGNGIRIIDDYAHHPTEIKVLYKEQTSIEDSKITVIFQPHRYSRVKFLLENFKKCF